MTNDKHFTAENDYANIFITKLASSENLMVTIEEKVTETRYRTAHFELDEGQAEELIKWLNNGKT